MMDNNDNNVQNTKANESKKNNKKKIILGLILILFLIAGIVIFYDNFKSKETETETGSEEYHLASGILGNGLDEFDLSFLKIEKNNKNIIYSPLSIKYALSMLSEGASGASKDQIDALIGEYKSNKYPNSSNMSLANAMFIKDTFKKNVMQSYIDDLKSKYNAEVIYDSFKTPDVINSWVNQKTLGLIPHLVDDISDRDFSLVNALAIDMEWNQLIQATVANYKDSYHVSYDHQEYSAGISPLGGDDYGIVKFNNGSKNAKAVEIGASINNYDIVNTLGESNIRETITREYTKWLNEDSCDNDEAKMDVTTYVNKYIKELNSNYKRVDTSTDFKFYDDENVKVFAKELKEYNSANLEYIGIMPKVKPLNKYIEETTAKDLSDLINKIKKVELDSFKKGSVYKITGGIPLFKYDYELNLMSDLKKLGVKDVFIQNKANLSKMVQDTKAVIDTASHKANIEFSNEGIKAAAVTDFGGRGAGIPCEFEYLYDVPVVEINLTFDNPYLYIIRDKKSGEVWFVGAVYEPTMNNEGYNVIE